MNEKRPIQIEQGQEYFDCRTAEGKDEELEGYEALRRDVAKDLPSSHVSLHNIWILSRKAPWFSA